MANNFAELAFTDAVKALQEKAGSRASYARMEKGTHINGFTEYEEKFIKDRDSFYLSTVGTNGYPYIQHRGGPKGFLKVLDKHRMGFIDFKGNMQFISLGNLETNNKVAIILVNYPARARLKIYARAEIIELKNDPELRKLLDLEGYNFKPDRMMVFHIDAYDWNCPQHITPRYTVAEIEEAFSGQRDYIAKLEAENKVLRTQIKKY